MLVEDPLLQPPLKFADILYTTSACSIAFFTHILVIRLVAASDTFSVP